MDRPLGVSLVAGVAAVFGFLYLILGIILLSGPLSPDAVAQFGVDTTMQVAALVVGLALTVFGISAWMGWKFAWFLGVAIGVIGLAAYVYQLFINGLNAGTISALVVLGLCFVYFLTPDARRAFGIQAASPEAIS